jgi:hypothetical protein
MWGNIETLVQAVFHGEFEIFGPGLPRLACASGATTDWLHVRAYPFDMLKHFEHLGFLLGNHFTNLLR